MKAGMACKLVTNKWKYPIVNIITEEGNVREYNLNAHKDLTEGRWKQRIERAQFISIIDYAGMLDRVLGGNLQNQLLVDIEKGLHKNCIIKEIDWDGIEGFIDTAKDIISIFDIRNFMPIKLTPLYDELRKNLKNLYTQYNKTEWEFFRQEEGNRRQFYKLNKQFKEQFKIEETKTVVVRPKLKGKTEKSKEDKEER